MLLRAILSCILVIIFICSIGTDPAFSVSGTSYEFILSKTVINHKKPIASAVFNPDGNLIATGSTDGSVKLWEVDTGKQIKAIIKHPNPVSSISFSPNGNLLAVGLDTGAITLWDINYKERIKTLKGHEGKVYSLRFNKDGSLLASGSEDKTVKLWDMKSGDEIKSLKGHTGLVYSIAFSPDDKNIASGSADGSVKIWEISSGKNTLTLKDTNGKAIHSISFSPDGNTLASGLADGDVRLWNVASGAEKSTLVGQKAGIGMDNCLSFSLDGKILASGSTNGTIMVWEVASGNVVNEQKSYKSINSIIFSPDSKSLALAGDDGIVKLWKIRVTESLKVTLNAPYDGWQRGILKLDAEVIGTPDKVTFQYSLDGSTWNNIFESIQPPYSVDWDTRQIFPDVTKNVQIRVVAERQPGVSAVDIMKSILSIDNQLPITNHDYDGLWHNSNFSINLSASDGDGIGILAIYYKINYGAKKDIRRDGQPKITDEGKNTLEYWSADKLENEEEHKVLSDIKLDKTPPSFSDWVKDPQVLSKEYSGNFRISLLITDNGSGLEGKTPQIDYHIGSDTAYSGYKNMTAEGDIWYYDISEPSGGWSQYAGKPIYYKVKCEDFAGNSGESVEQQELIGSTKVPPTVKITSVLKNWMSGKIKLEADASDSDGSINNVKFEYTLDGIKWIPLNAVSQTPFSIEWDTNSVVSDVTKGVKVQALATDNDGLVAKDVSSAFGIDNKPPTTIQDYDSLWHKANFTVNLSADDGNGSGIARTMYKLNDGYERSVQSDSQPEIDEQGENTVEYWSIDVAGNEETHKTLSGVKLDRFPPSVENWNIKKEDNTIHVEAKISDDYSGVDASPQFDYHIGSETQFSGYKDMVKKDNNLWRYDINLADSGDAFGKTLFCKVSAKDVAGNLSIKTWESEVTGETQPTTVVESKPQEESTKVSTTEPPIDTNIETKPIRRTEAQGEKSAIIWLSKAPNTVKPETTLTLKGKIEAKLTDNESVKVRLIAPGEVVYESNTYTDAKGDFDFDVHLSSDGEWKVVTSWDGNSKYQPATSDPIKIKVVSDAAQAQPQMKAMDLFSKKSIIIGVLALYLLIIGLSR
jgi:WD40 repeat protein